MIYADHFGLCEAPFNATPDPRFFYSNRSYDEAYATLLYGLRSRQGLIVLTGEVGTGKTTLLRRLMDELAPTTRFVFLYQTTLAAEELVEAICAELELQAEGRGRFAQLRLLNDFLLGEAERGSTVALLVDEAQHLSTTALEHLRLISNLETSREKLLQIVLVGQPELDTRLAEPALRQVRQRIAMRYHLTPITPSEVDAFIRHRLQVAGRDTNVFTPAAVRRIAAYTDGIPRLINIMCHATLLLAYASGARAVTARMVDETAGDLLLSDSREQGSRSRASRPGFGASAVGPSTTRFDRLRLRWAWIAAGTAAMLLALAAAGALRSGAFGIGYAAVVGQALAAIVPVGARSTSRPTDAPSPGPVAEPRSRGLHSRDPEILAASSPAAPSPRQPPSGQPDRETDRRGDGWFSTVPTGSNVSTIIAERHGHENLLVLDILAELNPHVPDLDRVASGEKIWVPALTLATLARRQRNGTYQLIVTSVASEPQANGIAESLRRRGYATRVTPRRVTSSLGLHRVVIDDLSGPGATGQAWATARRLGWTPTVSTSTSR